MNTISKLNTALLQTLGLSKESAEIVMGRIEDLEMDLSIAAFKYGKLTEEFIAARSRGARVRAFVQELADEGCSYGDNCPTFGERHGTCLSCKAKQALEEKL